MSEDGKGNIYEPTRSHLVHTPVDSGCLVEGSVSVKCIPGHLHVSSHRNMGGMNGQMFFALDPSSQMDFNASHTIKHLSFGPPFPGQVNPLTDVSSAPTSSPATFQYHLRVVPTVYEYLSRATIDSRQYSASDFVQEMDPRVAPHVRPGLYLRYDFSPTIVRRVETRRTFLQFLTSICAICGGLLSISGILDQVVYRTVESSKSK